jgi:hypothetical protein
MRKGMHGVAVGWSCLFLILFWLNGRDLLNWAMEAPFSQLLFLQIFNSALSAIIVVESLRTVVVRWREWNDRQHLLAVFYSSAIIFVVSLAMLTYGRL